MLEFTDKVIMTVQVPVSITEEDIENIIVSSFEGGSNSWIGIDNTTPEWEDKPHDEPLSTWATKQLIEGKSVTLYDVEDDDSTWELTLAKLCEGVKLNYTENPSDNDKDNWDAASADCIMQYALFGEIVYG